MQLKYSFKKEISQFFRTFKFWGILICVFSFGISTPLLFKFTEQMLKMMNSETLTAAFDPQQTPEIPSGGILGENISEMLGLYSDAGMMFYMTVAMYASYSMLVVMLLLMSAAGGEQKKRAMIVPMCSGLNLKSYLLPKFILYPMTIFVVHFIGALFAGFLCNVMFQNNHIPFDKLLLISLLISVYVAFMTAIFLSVGICTSRPGAAVPLVLLGEMILENLLIGLGLTEFHPFALQSYISAISSGEYEPSEHAAGIAVAAVLAIVISELMYHLTYGILNAKKVDNQSEDIPEF